MTPYNLFLDDIRNPKQVTWVKLPAVEWEIVRSVSEFKEFIIKKGYAPNNISLDHDLGTFHYSGHYSDEETGYDAAKWLVTYLHEDLRILPKIYIHSMNPVGRERIRVALNGL